MPKITRSRVCFEDLPRDLQTKALRDARLAISVTVTVPKDMIEYAEDYMDDILDREEKKFTKFIDKTLDKIGD